MQQQILFTLLVSVSAVLLVAAQNGPYPPRLSIPGAIAASPGRPQFRNEKLVRVRRPVPLRSQTPAFAPSVTPRTIEEPKPVTESAEDEQPDVFLPNFLREQQLAQAQQAQFQQQAAAFFNNEPNSIQDGPSFTQLLHQDDEPAPSILPAPAPTPRFQERQPSAATPSNRPVFNDYGIGAGIGGGNSQRFQPSPSPQAPQPQHHQQQRTSVIRTRPAAREPRPHFEAQAAPAPAPRPRPKPIQARPIDQNLVQDEHDAHPRRQRPIAQTLRKWRDENEDGSITWGYENDDGSFKEELIGTDCVTKGTYGYVDPDGNKREYHYETGIKCDPNTRETEEDLQQNGFINYEENRAVLPNGLEIDMSQLGKKKSKRPVNYRN